MAAAQRPKWIEPNTSWDDEDKGQVVEMNRPESSVDRFHNHEEMSPEGMARALSDLQASVEAMSGRLAAAESGAAGAAQATKDLGASMFKMGDAVSRRVKTLEESTAAAREAAEALAAAEKKRAIAAAKRQAGDRRLMFGALAAAVVAIAVAGGSVMMSKQAASHAPAAPVLYSPSASGGN
jgi:hypothetical protein